MKTKSIHLLVLILFLFGSVFISGYTSSQVIASPAAVNIGSCQMFPDNNFWNVPVDTLPVHPNSAQWINSIGAGDSFHMDFGSGTWDGGPIGIPYNIVSGVAVTKYNVDFYYPDESDAGPYPIPASPKIEWGGDHHILVVDTDVCKLYEIYDASFAGGQWSAGSGAIWDLGLNELRPETWTSADAAGLPILPGLARYDEISAGIIEHALRFTANCTADYYIWPARHKAQHGSCTTPVPFGARFRLKADYDISGFSEQAQVLLQAFKTYGIVLADNGSDWYVSGAPNAAWDNDQLHELDALTGSDFEAVDTSGLMVSQNSAATNQSNTPHVYSIKRLDANPTASSTLRFQVYFSEAVTGVDATDFDLTITGDIVGETISSVTGSGISYVVTVTKTSGYGDLQLDLLDDNTIRDVSNNPLGGVSIGDGDFTTGESYAIKQEHILNGGFNTFPTGTSKIPTNWKAVNFSTSDGKNTAYKQEGIASVKFSGTGVSKTLSQTLLLTGSTGDVFNFSFWVKGKSIPAAGYCRAQVLFYNGATLNPVKKTVNCTNGTSAFTQKSLAFTAPGNYTKIIVRFTYSKASGTAWFDAVSLTK